MVVSLAPLSQTLSRVTFSHARSIVLCPLGENGECAQKFVDLVFRLEHVLSPDLQDTAVSLARILQTLVLVARKLVPSIVSSQNGERSLSAACLAVAALKAMAEA